MMMNWLHYLLEANLYLAVAYGCYWLLFRRQTFYTANRLYLLVSTVLCFVIPLVQFEFKKPQAVDIIARQDATKLTFAAQSAVTPIDNDSFLTLNKAITSIYAITALLMLVWFSIKLYSLLKLIFANRRIKRNGYTTVYTNQSAAPFSFFRYLFVGDNGLPETVLQHELVHIRHLHSWDIVFTELLKIISWFNPVVYLLQNSLKALHEFEADQYAAGKNEIKDSYVNFLIGQAYQSNGVPFANHFSNQQLLKSRIIMLYQKRSGKLARLNYLVALPLCAGLLCASSMAFSKDYGWIKIGLKQTKTKSLYVDSLHPKLRLKVTNNGMTGVTDKLELKGYPGKNMTYTAQTLTAADRKYLMKNFGIAVETTTASATTTTLVLPPPPPPVEPSNLKSHDIPPPPPPTIVRFPLPKKAIKPAKSGSIKFPMPKVTKVIIPEPKIEVVKFPPPKVKTVRFPAPRVEVIKFPPPNANNEGVKTQSDSSRN